MKYLENSTLEALCSTFSMSAVDCILDFKLEAYSCKMVQNDKKQWKEQEQDAVENGVNPCNDRQPLSCADDFLALSASPIGSSFRMRHLSEVSCSGSDNDIDEVVLVDSVSRRTLFDLIGVLNCAFPDYDFSNTKSNSFSLISNYDVVVTALDAKFSSCVHNYSNLRDQLWTLIESEINPSECKIYGFKSNYAGDPFSEDGCLWDQTLLFNNKHLKRILLFSCRALSQNYGDVSNDQLWELEEDA